MAGSRAWQMATGPRVEHDHAGTKHPGLDLIAPRARLFFAATIYCCCQHSRKNAHSGPRRSIGEWLVSACFIGGWPLAAGRLTSPSMLFWFGSDRRPEAHQMVYGEEDRVFRVEHLSSAATYPRVALAELRPMQCRALADDERVESAFDASTVLPVVCWGASDPKEPAAGSRSCCVFLACSSTVLGFVSQPDTYIKSSSAYDQISKPRFCTLRAFERPTLYPKVRGRARCCGMFGRRGVSAPRNRSGWAVRVCA